MERSGKYVAKVEGGERSFSAFKANFFLTEIIIC